MTEARMPGVTGSRIPGPVVQPADQGVDAPLDPDRPDAIVEDLHDRADDVDARRGRTAPAGSDDGRSGAADSEDPDKQR